jgi:transposase
MDAETKTDRFVGIDVSKARVDVYIRPDGTAFGCATDAEGLGVLVDRLKPLSPCLAVLEAFAEAGLTVAIVNPRQVRKFAGAIGRLAKTDAIDAAVIAHFAQAVRPAARPLPDDLSVRLAELMARRRQLVVMINAEKQRLARARDRITQSSFKAVLKRLDAEHQGNRQADRSQPTLVRQTGSAEERARHRRHRRPHLDRRVARARPSRSPPDRRPRPDEPGQRPISRQAQDPRGPRRSPGAALHGLPGRHPA